MKIFHTERYDSLHELGLDVLDTLGFEVGAMKHMSLEQIDACISAQTDAVLIPFEMAETGGIVSYPERTWMDGRDGLFLFTLDDCFRSCSGRVLKQIACWVLSMAVMA